MTYVVTTSLFFEARRPPGNEARVSLAVSRSEIERILAESEFLQGFGFRLESLEDGTCALALSRSSNASSGRAAS